MKIKLYITLLAASVMMANYAFADEGLKVICASRADKPPVLDGSLEDECWQKAEVRADFTSPQGVAVPRPTRIRFVYDDQNLYLGLECQWDNIEILKKAVAEILEKHGPPPAGLCPWKQFVNCYGAEFFIDPGATRENYYQVLFNAAGQEQGQFKAMDSFPWLYKNHAKIKSAIHGNVWTAELAFPHKGMKVGDEWGLNVCRNDETYYSLWKLVGSAYHNPLMFGTLVVGNYAQWWETAWTKGSASYLDSIKEDIKKPAAQNAPLMVSYEKTLALASKVREAEEKYPPTSRENFERLYTLYNDFRVAFGNLKSIYEVCKLIEKVK